MKRNPSARPHTSMSFAIGRYVAAAKASPRAVGTADNEWALNALVTNGLRLLETESWKALMKYRNQILK